MKYFVDGGPAQQVTQFQPTFSQQGIGSLQQAPNIPAMEASPTDYSAAPTQQYGAPATSYSAAPAPMTAGLGSYMEGLKYKSATPKVYTVGAVGAPDDTTSPFIYDPVTQTYKPNPRYVAPVASAVTPSTRRVDTTGGSGSGGGSPGGGGGSGSGAAAVSAAEADSAQFGIATPDADAAATAAAAANDSAQFGIDGGYGGDGGDGEKAGGRIRSYVHRGSVPQGIASLGRGQDSMLVHMTPGEVQGLQRLAMSQGGSLTINPQTGLPEAGFLSSILPMIAGIGLNMAFPGSGALIGAGIGGLTALTSGSLSKGLMAGLGAYGGAGLGESLTSMGAQQAEALKAADLSKAMIEATPTSGSAAADLAFKQAQTVNSTANIDELVKQAAANPEQAMSPNAYREFLTNQASSTVGPTGDQILEAQRARMLDAIQNAPMGQATQDALARGPFQNSMQGISELTGRGTGTASDAFKGLIGNAANEKTGVAASGLGGYPGAAKTLGMAAAPLLSSAMEPGKFNPPANKPTQYVRYGDGRTPGYTPPKYNPITGNYDPAFYGPESVYNSAQGGVVGYKQGGIADFYPLTGDARGPGEKPQYSSDIYSDDSGAGINNNKTGRGVAGDDMGRGIHTNTPSGVEGLFTNTSAATLARYKTAKNAAKQAAALAELRKRANAVDDYGADTTSAAQGGLMHTYAAGGKLLRGPGDGMSDSIPAVIQGQRPQRAALADGEFVIPADVVSHLGNGSTEAGSKRLYSMMDKVRKARTGNPKQGKQINPDRFMPA